MGFGFRLNSPLFSGTGSSADVPRLFPVAINGRAYVIEPKKYQRATVELLRAPNDAAAEPGEGSLNTRGLWPRQQTDWRGGAGQDYLDDSDSARDRFSESKGLNPWVRRRLSLHYDTERKVVSANTNLKMLAVGSYVYWADGSNLKFATDADLSVVTTIAAGGAITSIATDGSRIYVARSGALLQYCSLGAGALGAFTVAFQPTLVCYANGRLFGALANRLCEIDAAGAIATGSLLDYTHRNTSFAWADIEPSSNGVYAVGSAGSLSEVYYVGMSTTTAGALAQPIIATPGFPAGETITQLHYYGGAILMGTDRGMRLAVVGTNNGLTFGPVREITGGVTAFAGEGQYVWFTWTNYDGTSTGLGRIDLEHFTGTLTPAYASDLMATAQGAVTGVVNFGGKRYFAVSASGLWGQTANLVASGTLKSGWITYSTHEAKVISSLDVRHDALAGTVVLSVAYEAEENDGGSVVTCGTSSTADSFGPTAALDAGRRKAEQVQVHVELRRDATATTTGPSVRRWSLRALPSPYRIDEIVVPIIMRSRVIAGPHDGSTIYYNPLDEYNYLKGLEGQGAIVTYQEGSSSYSVYVDRVSVEPEKWTEDGSFFEGLILVYMLTAQTAA